MADKIIHLTATNLQDNLAKETSLQWNIYKMCFGNKCCGMMKLKDSLKKKWSSILWKEHFANYWAWGWIYHALRCVADSGTGRMKNYPNSLNTSKFWKQSSDHCEKQKVKRGWLIIHERYTEIIKRLQESQPQPKTYVESTRQLNGCKEIWAINIYGLPVIRYPATIITSPQEKIEATDIEKRQLLTIQSDCTLSRKRELEDWWASETLSKRKEKSRNI